MTRLRDCNATYAGKRILASPYLGILASQIAAETATGDNGEGILYNESIDPAYDGTYLRAWITNPPAVGSLTVSENGAIEAFDLPDGEHTFNYDLIVNGVCDSASFFTVLVGVVDAAASGGTGTGVGSGAGGEAVGAEDGSATALGGTGFGDSLGYGGNAIGEFAAVASGGTGSGVGRGFGGSASDKMYANSPCGSGYRRLVINTIRPKQQNTTRH